MKQIALACMVCGIAISCRSDKAPPSSSNAAADSLGAISVAVDSVLTTRVSAGSITAPRAVNAGWRKFTVERADSANHILVAFQLDPELSTAKFVALLDSLPGTPAGAVGLGGPEGRATDEVLVRFPAGRVVVACVSRGEDGHRHASKGELAEVEVRPAVVTSITDSTPPDSTVFDIPMSDFAFTGPDRIPASTRHLRVRNRGQQAHQLRIARLKSGNTLADWMKNPEAASETTADFGMARLGPLREAYVALTLQKGDYVFYCLVTDPKSKMQHVELGMLKNISVIP
ncbi:MAG: hypothetical protein H7Z40_13240 [Phycisphaerae bacterium]|nr:hypothetical protein [Gemmatimonadaceae bacterium]